MLSDLWEKQKKSICYFVGLVEGPALRYKNHSGPGAKIIEFSGNLSIA